MPDKTMEINRGINEGMIHRFGVNPRVEPVRLSRKALAHWARDQRDGGDVGGGLVGGGVVVGGLVVGGVGRRGFPVVDGSGRNASLAKPNSGLEGSSSRWRRMSDFFAPK